MKDSLEEFINNNRDEFEIHEPPEHLWQSINKEIQKNKRPQRFQNSAIAASIIIVIGLATWLMFSPSQKKITHNDVATAAKPTIQDAEIYYASLVKTQQSQLQQYCNNYPGLCKDFKNELDTLNNLYGQLKTTYDQSYSNEAVLQAMIENLQAQVKLLSLQLQIIQNLKQKESDDNPHLKTT